MKDFIANLMDDRDWRKICRKELPMNLERKISDNNSNLYERSYAVIRKLAELKVVIYWHEMKEILNLFNKHIVNRFEKKFLVQIAGKETTFIYT